ncbi:neurotransmitter:Na+ symporter, NSS family [Alkalithermobacter thermoalcaliphilus JW-YL-7 = DSM 7308]|uniref:Transporter n=1 Tax=Alkalithermobacter thermoalcaliphilus JW-YL-7 = DSM 7308 TaxID=1121328 RepID=A0A150FSG7_CLOPD|nr:sodium:neurotransmitter symporter [[Clostridium] paradoxum JW-YL-7 = DSM 7308]SHK70556.1 neurotransmitter:Na+ symporter, NSS family [[Clostridium] paradoxum JW-YL-7 = DSM 7308]
MEKRDQWKSRTGFLMGAIGAAIGLGNLWRFPYQAYSSGGGAFLIPYIFALFTAGIPLMIMELGFGSKMKGAAPLAFRKLGGKWEFLGWWQVMIPLVVMTFYSCVIAWSVNYLFMSFSLGWGDDAGRFFIGEFLKLSSSPWEFGGLRVNILIAVLFVWIINYSIVKRGISGGIEKACKFIMPLLAILMLIMTLRGVTLPGARHGLSYLFNPDFSKILDHRVWISAYSQVFFSTTLAVGVMIAYSSYLPEKSDIVGNAHITVLANASFDILAGLCVFGLLGYYAYSFNIPFDEVMTNGAGLAFVAFPTAISNLPMNDFFKSLFGFMFFFALIIAGISSSVSMLESFASAILDKYDIKRDRLIKFISIFGFFGSALFATRAGVFLLDIVDHFVGNYGIALIGLVEAIVLGYVYKAEKMKEDVNQYSSMKVGAWWVFCIKYITPVALSYLFIQNVISEFKAPYGSYPISALIVFGLSVALGMFVISHILAKKPWKKGVFSKNN